VASSAKFALVGDRRKDKYAMFVVRRVERSLCDVVDVLVLRWMVSMSSKNVALESHEAGVGAKQSEGADLIAP
jgi:hypothetical protein